MENHEIVIEGLNQNNLKNVSLTIPREKIVVFTGVSGSGKSSIVFDTIAAESQRQMNETYTAFMRGRLPKYEKPNVEYIDNLTASVIVDQTRLGGNARSTVGTISDLYSALRVLYSRIGLPYVGTASYFSFNDPNGMCLNCFGIGKTMELDIHYALDEEKSWNEGMVDLPAFHPGNWYFKIYMDSKLFDPNKKLKNYTTQERNLLLYGAYEKGGKQVHKKVAGIYNHFSRLILNRESASTEPSLRKIERMIKQVECPCCRGKRLNESVLECRINGLSIYEMCELEFTALRTTLLQIKEEQSATIIESMVATLTRMIDIGLPYLFMNRASATLSGGEAQRLKLVRYMGSSLTGMTYIFDEPSTGMHPRDVYRMSKLLQSLRNKGNTVLVVEHDKDIISIADEIIDIGPLAGKNGGQVLFQGNYENLLLSNTITGKAMKEVIPVKEKPRKPTKYLSVQDACLHNLKNISLNIPLNILTVVTGVAGSGKSTLMKDIFAKKYEDRVVLVDQSQIVATSRSNSATSLGFFDEIRKVFAKENNVSESLFSFNSKGACPECKGKGVKVTELVFMDPVSVTCEKCKGNRYSEEALTYMYKGKSIINVLEMNIEEALAFFEENKKIHKKLKALYDVGLSYLSIGQPLSTLSGGERQRLKLAKHINDKGNIYILDEPTTGLHAKDIKSIMHLLDNFVKRGNTVIVIEHNLDVMKQADYIIDIGPDGGTQGGEVVFTGTPKEMIDQGNTITADYLKKSNK